MHSRPEGDWCCSNCKDNLVPGRKMISGDSSLARPIVIRLTRVVKEPEYEIGGCGICRFGIFHSFHLLWKKEKKKEILFQFCLMPSEILYLLWNMVILVS